MNDSEGFRTVRGYLLLRRAAHELTPGMEDYLEMIYRIEQSDHCVRAHRLAKMLNVQAPSVSRVLRRLAQKGYIQSRPYGAIHLTAKGNKLGEFLLRRHTTVQQFLQHLGVHKSLLTDTELIEHHLSEEALTGLELLNEFLQQYPQIRGELCAFIKQQKTKRRGTSASDPARQER